MLLTHIGRTSGHPRQVVLEVIGADPQSAPPSNVQPAAVLVASGFGARAQWYRNVVANPHVRFQIAAPPLCRHCAPLGPAESGRLLAAYAQRRPRTAAALMGALGHTVDDLDSYRRIGADLQHGVALVALRPS